MSYELYKEWSVLNMNLSVWRMSYSIYSRIQLHNYPQRPGAHGSDIRNWLWYVKEIKKKEPDAER
jgi:hypothetical protein